MIPLSLDPGLYQKLQTQSVIKSGDNPTFQSYVRWSENHIYATSTLNNRLESVAHYRNNKLSSYTEWDCGSFPTKVIRNFFGTKINMTGLFQQIDNICPKLLYPGSTPGY